MRDGTPLPGLTPDEVVSQLIHRVLGPMNRRRLLMVLDFHALAGSPSAPIQTLAHRYGVTPATVTRYVKLVRAAGAVLPVSDELADQISQQTQDGGDHRARVRMAATLNLPAPRRPDPPPRRPEPIRVQTSAKAAVRILTAIGPQDISILLTARDRARRHKPSQPLDQQALAQALHRIGAVRDAGGRWHPPPGAAPTDTDQALVRAAAGRDLTRKQLIALLTDVGYTPSSAAGVTNATHPLFHRTGRNQYSLIAQPAHPRLGAVPPP